MKFDINEFENQYYIRDGRILNITIEYEEYSNEENKPNQISIILKASKIQGKRRLPVKINLSFINPKEFYYFEDFASQPIMDYYRLLKQSDNTYYFSIDPYADDKMISHKDDNQYIICENIIIKEL